MMAGYDSLDPSLSDLFSNLESQHKLPAGLLKAVAYTESGYNPRARSGVGASGMFQFMPATAKQYGVDVSDPISSAKGAAQMYADLLKQNGGDTDKALAGYNWGQANVNKKGLENAPAETRNYIKRVNGLMGNKTMSKDEKPIPEAAYAAYDALVASKQSPEASADTSSDIPPEAYAAYDALVKAQQPVAQQPIAPAQAAAVSSQPSESEMRAAMGLPPVVDPNAAQANLQGQAVQNPQGSQAILNGQAAQAGVQPVAPIPGKDMYDAIVRAASNGQDISKVWNQLSDRQKDHVGKLLQGAYVSSGGQDSTAKNLYEGLVYSAQKLNEGVEQIGNYLNPVAALRGDYKEKIDAKNADIARRQALREMNTAMKPSSARTAGEIAGDVLQWVTGEGVATSGARAVAGATPGLIVKGSGIGARAADLGAQGAIASTVSAPVVNAANPEDTNFLGGKLAQAATGAVAGAVGGVAAEKAVGAIANKIAKVSNARNPQISAADQAYIDSMEAQGIRWLPSDVPSAKADLRAKAQRETFNNETLKNEVNAQQAELTTAVKKAVSNLKKPDATKIADETGLSKIIDDTSSPYHFAAKSVKEKIDNVAPDDPNAILKYGAEAQQLGKKAQSNKLYQKEESLVPEGTSIVPENISDVFIKANNYMKDLATPSKKSEFKSVLDDISAAFDKAVRGGNSYKDFNNFFREMGDSARNATRNGDAQGARFYNEMKSAINKDKEAFINSLPDSTDVRAYKKAYEEATRFNRENVQNIKTNKLESLFNAESKTGTPNLPDQAIEKWVKSGQTEKVKQIWEALPETSKDAVTSGVMNRILKNSVDADGNVMPKKFIDNYKAYEDKTSGQTPLSVILDPSAKKTFDDLVRNMGTMQNIGYNKANPINGSMNREALQNLGGMARLQNAVTTFGLSEFRTISNFLKNKAFIKGMTDPKFKKLMISLNNSNPASPKYAKAAAELSAYISANYAGDKEK